MKVLSQLRCRVDIWVLLQSFCFVNRCLFTKASGSSFLFWFLSSFLPFCHGLFLVWACVRLNGDYILQNFQVLACYVSVSSVWPVWKCHVFRRWLLERHTWVALPCRWIFFCPGNCPFLFFSTTFLLCWLHIYRRYCVLATTNRALLEIPSFEIVGNNFWVDFNFQTVSAN